MFQIVGQMAEGSVEIMEARTPKQALRAAVDMTKRGRERISIQRRGSGTRSTALAFAIRHGFSTDFLESGELE